MACIACMHLAPTLSPVQTPQQRQLDPFEAISLGPAAPGQPEAANPLEFPRPAGPDASAADAFPEPAHPRNCSARFMRLTVNAIPAQQVWEEGSGHVGQAFAVLLLREAMLRGDRREGDVLTVERGPRLARLWHGEYG